MPVFEVEMVAFKDIGHEHGIRRVDVPDKEYKAAKTDEEILDLVYKWGQNDFQRRDCPSVSVGDVIHLKGERYLVSSMGFKRLEKGEEGGMGAGYGIKLPKIE